VPRLAPLWNAHRHRRLVEPFCGGMAVTSGFLPYRALLNDSNPHLMNFYRQLQRGFRIEMPTENNEVLYCAYGTRFSLLVLFDGAIELRARSVLRPVAG
jgi:DNA adenine methylase